MRIKAHTLESIP